MSFTLPIKVGGSMKKDDLNDRLFSFAVLGGGISLQENIANSVIIFIKSKRNKNDSIQPPELLKLLPQLPKTPEFNIIRYQLAKSSTSSGANYSPRQI
ncbi:MAG: hypothetical protein IPJ03_18305 [Ignavibacteriales bacterium]|nr:hypothetical protein [Ignavibacteriales bacterium]